jgi:hypothetical protein
LSQSTSSAHLDDLETLASRAGEHWASACANQLRRERRPVVGGWPGTLSEAHGQVLLALAGSDRTVTTDRLRALSRTAYRAARAAWQRVAVPDDEH